MCLGSYTCNHSCPATFNQPQLTDHKHEQAYTAATGDCRNYFFANGVNRYKNQCEQPVVSFHPLELLNSIDAISLSLAYVAIGSFSMTQFVNTINPSNKNIQLNRRKEVTLKKTADWVTWDKLGTHQTECIVMTAFENKSESTRVTEEVVNEPSSSDSGELFSDSRRWLEGRTPKQPNQRPTMSAPTPSSTPKKKALLKRKVRSERFPHTRKALKKKTTK